MLADVRVPSGQAQEELVRRSDVSRKWVGAVDSDNRVGAAVENLIVSLRVAGVG